MWAIPNIDLKKEKSPEMASLRAALDGYLVDSSKLLPGQIYNRLEDISTILPNPEITYDPDTNTLHMSFDHYRSKEPVRINYSYTLPTPKPLPKKII